MPKRKWARHKRGDADYSSNLRRVLPTASGAARQAVSAAVGVDETLAIHDSSRLFVEELIETTDNDQRQITYYDPVRLVQFVLDNCSLLAQRYGEIAMDNPDSTWRLIIGYDEQTPGSKLNRDNQRKNMVIVMNFLELGADILESDDSWFIPLVCRSEILKCAKGGWSAILRKFLRRAILSTNGFNGFSFFVRFKHHGADRCVMIKAKLHTLLTDGEGHQKTLQWNGPSSLKPSFKFANVFKRGAGMDDAGANYVDITCSDITLLRRWTYDSWQRNIDGVLRARERHERGELSQRDLQMHIKGAGFSVTREGLLADMELRPFACFLDVCVYDFMHTAFQNGYMSNAMWLICSHTLRLKYGSDRDAAPLVAYLRAFQFPSSRADGRRLYTIFSKVTMPKHRLAQSILANASCQLYLYPLLEAWAIEESRGSPDLLAHCAVYCAACATADIMMNVKYRRLDTQSAKDQLLRAIARWQDLHKLQYGVVHFKPKFFWLWSNALDLSRSEWLFDMFAVERQHRRVRAQVEPIKNTTQFEGSVLQRVLDAQLSALQEVDLLAKKYSFPGRHVKRYCGGQPACMADSCVCRGVSLHVDDIVEHEGDIGVIIACFQYDSNGLMVVQVELMRRMSRTHFQATPDQRLWRASCVQLSLAWKTLGNGLVEVVASRKQRYCAPYL